ncbi:MAG TPA: hypothetical protein VJ576_14460 [Rhodocyclaceae bacterium]|nr:hypothetical protein [Rhodocyclaceae bacterium]
MRRLVFLLCCCLHVLAVRAEPDCRIAYDLGSSGIRVGSDAGSRTVRTDIDYLGDLWADQRIDSTLPETVWAFRDLPRQAGFPENCVRVAGGFSAWRLALAVGTRDEVVHTLAKLHEDTGVAVLIVPQRAEGRYGYVAAETRLDGRLHTSHILDIGGGSLQVAGRDSAWGGALGQKAWNRLLCDQLHPGGHTPCNLAALDAEGLAEARRLMAKRLDDLASAVPGPVTLTAISRPVSQEVHPALRQLAAEGQVTAEAVDAAGFGLGAVQSAIARLAPLPEQERVRLTGIRPPFSSYLLSDLLLVEGILRATGATRLEVAELDLSNVPGLLADDHAFTWAGHYDCYLERLRRLGEAAYDADPAQCGCH